MIQAVTLYKTSDGNTFEYEDEALYHETKLVLDAAHASCFDIDGSLIDFDDPHIQNADVFYITIGDATEEQIEDVAEALFDWNINIEGCSHDKIKANTSIMYDGDMCEWMTKDEYKERVGSYLDKIKLLDTLEARSKYATQKKVYQQLCS